MVSDIKLLLVLALSNLLVIQGVRSRATQSLFDTSTTTEEYPNDNNQLKCGYSSCPKIQEHKLNIHLVPHTHDDVGWLKTVDEYYYGTMKHYDLAGVQYILDSVIPELVMDRSKRFIYVEMSFFSKWWEEQDDKMKQIVKGLVNNGQLEFINGGWCMNDEATTTYQSIIDQMTIGLKFLEENFGQCARPRVGWQIDPFGHSNEQASLFAQFGFDGMFFQRVHYMDKWSLSMSKSLDLIWRGDEALASDSGSIYTNVFIDTYNAPSTFCFDTFCLDSNLVDNRKSYEYNIEERVSSFIGYAKYYAQHKRTNHIMIPMGGDFQYTSARQNFKNLDKLIKYLNKMRPDQVNAFYSTPSCYQYALNEAGKTANISWPQKLNDFFPYATDEHTYWTGYFTSRPALKLFERKASTILQVSRQMALIKMINNSLNLSSASNNFNETINSWNYDLQSHNDQCLEKMWQVMGDLQHHDAVTGTEKQHVANDYLRRATDAINQCMSTLTLTNLEGQLIDTNQPLKHSNGEPVKGRRRNSDTKRINKLAKEATSMWCPALNISNCWATEYYLRPISDSGEGIRVNLFNPLSEKLIQTPIRLPCPSPCELDKLSIRDMTTGEYVSVMEKVPLNAGLEKLKFRVSLADEEVQFYANLPPVGYNSYEILVNRSQNYSGGLSEQPTKTTAATNGNTATMPADAPNNVGRMPFEHVYNSNRWIRTSPYYNDQDLGIVTTTSDDETNTRQQQKDKLVKLSIGLQKSTSSANNSKYLSVNMSTGQVEGIYIGDDYLQIKQQFGFYLPVRGNRSSGAYIMRPASSDATMFGQPEKFKIFKSEYILEIHQQWNDWIWQTIRADAYLDYIEYDYVVGPLPKDERNKLGTELISRYETDLNTQGVFYTDSNGRQLVTRRTINSNDTSEPVSANYYPVTTTIMLKDTTPTRPVDLAILTDRAQGGTSLANGELELLIHRRLLVDDNFGVGQALNELGEDGRGLVIRGQHRVLVRFNKNNNNNDDETRYLVNKRDNLESSSSHQQLKHGTFQPDNSIFQSKTALLMDKSLDRIRQQSIRFLLRPIVTFEPIKKSADRTVTTGPDSYAPVSLLNNSLPSNVHLLTVQPWKDKQILLRLENLQNPLTFHKSLYPDDMYKQMLDLYKEMPVASSVKPNDTTSTDQSTSGDDSLAVATAGQRSLADQSPKCKRLHSHYQRSKYDGRYHTHRLPCANNQFLSGRNITNEQLEQLDSICLERQRVFYSQMETKFDVEFLFNHVRIVDLQEMTLGANENLDQLNRLNWNTKSQDDSLLQSACDSYTPLVDNSQTSVTLTPRQIRTYIARIEKI